ncbi:hypothetical protein PV325_010180 [Microctonus aethiopoides]|nr:hypothetical protein PV325_010180 [Microctonus aethiopoides]
MYALEYFPADKKHINSGSKDNESVIESPHGINGTLNTDLVNEEPNCAFGSSIPVTAESITALGMISSLMKERFGTMSKMRLMENIDVWISLPKRRNADISKAGKERNEEILKLPDLNNYSSDDETNIKENGEKDKNANAINYCENCAKCICRSWAALVTPEIIGFINVMSASLNEKNSPSTALLRQEEFKVLCPKTDIFITETNKKWAIAQSNNKARSLIINIALCLVSAEKLAVEYVSGAKSPELVVGASQQTQQTQEVSVAHVLQPASISAQNQPSAAHVPQPASIAAQNQPSAAYVPQPASIAAQNQPSAAHVPHPPSIATQEQPSATHIPQPASIAAHETSLTYSQLTWPQINYIYTMQSWVKKY